MSDLTHLALVGAREYVVRATRTLDYQQAERAQKIVDLIDKALKTFHVEPAVKASDNSEGQWEPPGGWNVTPEKPDA